MRGAATALVVVAVTSADAAAQVLEPYYTPLPVDVIDPSYRPHANITTSVDLDGDGNQDLVLLGWTFPTSDVTAANHRPQPGRVFLGDGDGGFRRAPAELFPVDTLNTVNPSCCPQFGDLNGDGLPDMFLPMGGWDAEPFPGEQNRLYLSRPGGGWRDATSELPPLSDFTHSAAIGDIRGLGAPALDGRGAGAGADPDPGAARDGAPRRGAGAGVSTSSIFSVPRPRFRDRHRPRRRAGGAAGTGRAAGRQTGRPPLFTRATARLCATPSGAPP